MGHEKTVQISFRRSMLWDTCCKPCSFPVCRSTSRLYDTLYKKLSSVLYFRNLMAAFIRQSHSVIFYYYIIGLYICTVCT